VRELSGQIPTPETTTPLLFGRPVRGSDGQLGRLTDVVVTPEERNVTHLVVEDQGGKARLVPAERLVQGRAPDDAVVLTCSTKDLEAYDSIRSFSYVGFADTPHEKEGTDVGVEDVLVMPSFGALAFSDYAGDFGSAYGVTYDSIPAGSAELRRESLIVSENQEMVGNLDGFLVAGQRLTHAVLQHTHLWGGAAAIPIESVVAIDTDYVTIDQSTDTSAWIAFQ
jgi:sporulation protein YlmC with PRC-barrel domain